MISVWFQFKMQDAQQPDPHDTYRLKEFDTPDKAFEWISQNSENVAVKRITGDDLELTVKTVNKPTYKRKKPSLNRRPRRPEPPDIEDDEDDEDF